MGIYLPIHALGFWAIQRCYDMDKELHTTALCDANA